MDKRKRASWADLIISVLIVALCIGLFVIIFNQKSAEARYGVLYCDNQVLARYDLSIDATYSPDTVRFPGLIIQVKDGAIRFSENDCPDQICVHTGFLSHTGTYAVCLPYRLKLAVEGGVSEVDNG